MQRMGLTPQGNRRDFFNTSASQRLFRVKPAPPLMKSLGVLMRAMMTPLYVRKAADVFA